MRIGKLNTPFLLQEESLSADGAGGSVAAWQTLVALWGDLRVASDESPANLKRRITHHVIIRHRAERDVRTGQRLVLNERQFLIRAVSNVGEADRWLKLFVEEILPLN